MALQPEDDGVFVWPPIHWAPPPLAIDVPEYGSTVTGAPTLPPPPPPPPPPPQRIAVGAPGEEVAAAPPPPPAVDPSPMQPGLGIPAATVDAAGAQIPSVPLDPLAPETWAAPPITAQPPPEPVVPPLDEPAPDSPFFDPLAPQSWTNPLGSADIYDLAQRDPRAAAEYAMAHDQAAAAEQHRQAAALAHEDAIREEQNFRDLQDSQAKAAELHDQILNTKINPNRARESRGLLQSIAAFASVVIGGLYQARKGGPNIGLQILDQATDRDIAAQEADLGNKRNMLADLRAQGMSTFQAKQAYRVAVYARAKDELLAKAQDFDPAGTTALNMARQAMQMDAAMAQAAEAGRRNKLEEELKRRKDERESLETMIKLREADAKIAKMQGAGAGGVMLTPEEIKRDYNIVVTRSMKPSEVTAELERRSKAKTLSGNDAVSRKQEADATEAEAKAEAAKNGFAIANPETGEPLTNKDKTPFVVMDATERERLRSIAGAAQNIRRLADRVAELKKKNGGNWKVLGSDEAQEIQSLVSQVDFETFKAFQLGAPSEGDKALAEGVRGGVDPSSFVKNASAGFQAYADGVEKKALGHMRAAGYTGAPLKFHRAADQKKSGPTVVDEATATIAGTRYDTDNKILGREWGGDVPDPTGEIKKVDEAFSTLAAFAELEGPKGDAARKSLAALADPKGAASADARAKAKKILDALPGSKARTDEAR